MDSLSGSTNTTIITTISTAECSVKKLWILPKKQKKIEVNPKMNPEYRRRKVG